MGRNHAAALVALLALIGCSEEQPRTLDIELAPRADADRCATARASLPEETRCVRIAVCAVDGDTCAPVPLSDPEGDHANEATPFTALLEGGTNVTFDAKLAGGEHRVSVDLVGENGRILASGTGAMHGGATASVRLYPYATASCPGPRLDGTIETLPAPRALHAALPLPNGDVLLIGGVTGTAISTRGFSGGAVLQRAVEVYLAEEQRFATVEGELGRVLFAASVIDESIAAGRARYRIRLVGGFSVPGDEVAIRFDAAQANSPTGSPILPGASALVADTTDVFYEPEARRLVIDTDLPGSLAGFNASTERGVSGHTAVLLGLSDAGGLVMPRPRLAKAVTWFDENGMPSGDSALVSGRLGGTITRLVSAEDTVLVWGGNVEETSREDARNRAGELIRRGQTMTTPVRGGLRSGLPEPVALHTATPIRTAGRENDVLIAGGLEVGCFGATGCPSQGIATTYADPVLTVLHFGPGPATHDVVEGMARATILHAAIAVPIDARNTGVVVTGGAGNEAGRNLAASNQLVFVRPTATGYMATAFNDGIGALTVPRFGHAVARTGDLLLVTGGFTSNADQTLDVVSVAEAIPLRSRPTEMVVCPSGP